MSEIFSTFEQKFHTAFVSNVSWQPEFSFRKFWMITNKISHIFCVRTCQNRRNWSILTILKSCLTFLRFSDTGFRCISKKFSELCDRFFVIFAMCTPAKKKKPQEFPLTKRRFFSNLFLLSLNLNFFRNSKNLIRQHSRLCQKNRSNQICIKFI